MFQVTQEANSGLLSISIGGATHSHVSAKDTVKVPPFALKLSDSLESFVLSPCTALLQYVDDLMICSLTNEQPTQSNP